MTLFSKCTARFFLFFFFHVFLSETELYFILLSFRFCYGYVPFIVGTHSHSSLCFVPGDLHQGYIGHSFMIISSLWFSNGRANFSGCVFSQKIVQVNFQDYPYKTILDSLPIFEVPLICNMFHFSKYFFSLDLLSVYLLSFSNRRHYHQFYFLFHEYLIFNSFTFILGDFLFSASLLFWFSFLILPAICASFEDVLTLNEFTHIATNETFTIIM